VTVTLPFLRLMRVCVGTGGGGGVWVCMGLNRGNRGESDVEVMRVE